MATTAPRPATAAALLVLALAAPAPARGQARSAAPTGPLPALTAGELEAHLRFLGSDLLERRAADTRGGRLAAAYVAAALQAGGAFPGADDGAYVQRVPVAVVTVDTGSLRATLSGRATGTLRWGDDVIAGTVVADTATMLRDSIVFVGYGISAPARGWDDYAGADVRGRIVLALRGEPTTRDTVRGRFRLGGREPSWWGTDESKREEARRRGAAALVTLYPDADSTAPWAAAVRQAALPQRQLPRDSAAPRLAPRIAIRERAAAAFLQQAGLDLGQLAARAAEPGFRAVPTGVVLSVTFASAVERRWSENVVGYVRGRDARSSSEHAVVLTVHWDQPGAASPTRADSAHGGAGDEDASGVALLLAVARAAAQGPPPRRSLVFLFTTAVDSGLLGARWFAAHPTVPLARVDAAIDVDGGNLWGRTYDVVGVGAAKSSLGTLLESVAARQELRVTPDPFPERGSFLRSDQLPFAAAGVPSIWVRHGVLFVGRPPEWGIARTWELAADGDHPPAGDSRPGDARAGYALGGLVQQAELVRAFALAVADAGPPPAWAAASEFSRPRPAPPAR